MKIKTDELIGPALDLTVAKREGIERWNMGAWHMPILAAVESFQFSPSTHWSQGGPIIEREIGNLWKHNKLDPCEPDCWTAITYCPGPGGVTIYHKDGPTPLVAAMRCYVAAKLGDEVEVPDELCL